MSDFWLGYLAAIGTYFTIGAFIGIAVVISHLPRFFAAGFQWKRMAKHVGQCMLLWPMAVVEYFS